MSNFLGLTWVRLPEFSESTTLLIIFIIIFVTTVIGFIFYKFRKDLQNIVIITVAIINIFTAIGGGIQIQYEPFKFKENIQHAVSGQWVIKSKYNVYKITNGEKIPIDNETGIGEQYLWMNPETNTFNGLGWINIGSDKIKPIEALYDTIGNDLITFRINNGFLNPNNKEQFVVETVSIQKTIRRTDKNLFKETLCFLVFPVDINENSWEGSGTCKLDDIYVDVNIELIKREQYNHQ